MQLQFLEHCENEGEWCQLYKKYTDTRTLWEKDSVARLLTTVLQRIKMRITLKL